MGTLDMGYYYKYIHKIGISRPGLFSAFSNHYVPKINIFYDAFEPFAYAYYYVVFVTFGLLNF